VVTADECLLLFLPLQAHEKRISQLKQTLSSLPPLDTQGQLSDLMPYYHTVTELRTTTEALQVYSHTHSQISTASNQLRVYFLHFLFLSDFQRGILESVNGLKALSVGRVVVVNNKQHLNALGVILQAGVFDGCLLKTTHTLDLC